MDEAFGGGEILTWEALRDLAPFGLRGEWVRWAAQQALLASVNRDPKRRPQPYSLNDFLPEWLRYEGGQGDSVEGMAAFLEASWGE